MKRRGFTLIELMVVIAIIIILAAIAIPNYLQMTERAKRSRIASDMATLATGLETFKTDWGPYPVHLAFEAVDLTASTVYIELAGLGAGPTNKTGNTNALGETAPLVYLKAGTLLSIVDPFKVAAAPPALADGHVYYSGSTDGEHWELTAYAPTTVGGVKMYFMTRTDSSSTVVSTPAAPGPLT